MKTRFIREVGTRAKLRIYWGDDCPNSVGGGLRGYHNAERHLVDQLGPDTDNLGGSPKDHAITSWPTKCSHCEALVPADRARWDGYGTRAQVPYEQAVRFQVFRRRLYDSPSGQPEPGDLFFCDWYGCLEESGCPWWGTTCSGRHLFCVLPNGRQWDIDGRANNCTMLGDNTHRCWVRRGDPERGEPVHVDKGGNTCAAGAGSILVPGWHGFLTNGELVQC